VRGGDDVIRELELRRKLCTGRSASSSSLNSGDGGSSGTVLASETNERLCVLFEGNCACLVRLIGDDSGKSWFLFQVCWFRAENLFLRPVAAPDEANVFMFIDRRRLTLPPERSSSENIGPVSGEELKPLLECKRLDVVDAVSEIVSTLLAVLFFFMRSSTWGSMASRLMFSQPFCLLTLASARRSCKARVIWPNSVSNVVWMQRFTGAKQLSQHGVHTFDTCALRSTLLATSSGRVGWNVAAMATTARSRAQSSGVLCVC
jgi:hypothetical protein